VLSIRAAKIRKASLASYLAWSEH